MDVASIFPRGPWWLLEVLTAHYPILLLNTSSAVVRSPAHPHTAFCLKESDLHLQGWVWLLWGYFYFLSRLLKDWTFDPILTNELLDVGDTFFPALKKEPVHLSPSPDMYQKVMNPTDYHCSHHSIWMHGEIKLRGKQRERREESGSR